jgi:N5-(cytidine 5'-diphosphoramidyl)-L-glutamine hydrolase
MMKVGISCRITEAMGYKEERNSLALDWISLFEKLHICPVLIPNGIKNISTFIRGLDIDAVILSGGNNVSPSNYGSVESLNDVYKIRDDTEMKIINVCIEDQIPLIGICRGMTMINVHLGGTVTHYVSGHAGVRHEINLSQDSGFDKRRKSVNSFHRQAIRIIDLADALVAFAVSDDGLVEGFRHKKLKIYGMQWHPERDIDDIETLNILKNMMEGNER